MPTSQFHFARVFCLAAALVAVGASAQQVVHRDGVSSGGFVAYVQDELIVELTVGGAASAQQGPADNAFSRMPEFARAIVQANVVSAQRQFPGAIANSGHREDERLTRIYKVKFRGNLETALRAFVSVASVVKAEPIGIHAVSAVPNDPYYDNPPLSFPYDQWHYRTPFGVNAQAAWDTETGDPNVVVGVLDTGVRYWHTDLGGPNAPWTPATPQTNGNIWVNAGEIPNNGVDDDGNGFIDDTVGYDFVSAGSVAGTTCIDADCSGIDNDPRDGNGHGTHVAGTIAAITNNASRVAGVAGGFSNGLTTGTGNGVKILSLRIGWTANYLGQEVGLVRMDFAAAAMQYVAELVDSGVNVTAINCSWGSSNSGGIDAAVDALLTRDVMVIHAAGNSSANSPGYLGDKAGVMNVGATDVNGSVASFSNFGAWVDIAAPGVDILSTFHYTVDPANDYIASMSGTSMAAPHAAGVAALLESYNPALTGPDKFVLMQNTSISYNGATDVGDGIVNAYNAILSAPNTCAVTADFSADTNFVCGSGTVNFTNLSTGPATGYLWDFGDGNTSTAVNPSHDYASPGQYTIELTVFSADCSDTETRVDSVTVGSAPTAAFSANPVNGTAPLNVNFTDQSTGQASSWSWNFGDGGTSILQNPTHQYTTPGTYTVSLTVTNSCGSDGETQTNLIVVEEAPASQRVYASSDLPMAGTVQGSFAQTLSSDNARETISEVSSNGNPARRRSSAEHRWAFVIPAAAPSAMLVVEASRTDNSEGDNFRFEYSPDGSAFAPILVVDNSVEQVYSAQLPDVPSGTVYVRVVDTDNSQGNASIDSVSVDEMYIETSQTVNNAPTVSISSPANGANPASGASVTLAASASDTEEGGLSAQIEWTSSADGFLGTGANLNVVLSDGPHTITAYVEDSTGLSGTDSVDITIGTPSALQVIVYSDQPSYATGSTAIITVIAFDGVNLVPNADVRVDIATPKGRTRTGTNTTDILGTALFTYQVNDKKDGSGTYNVTATVNAPGYDTGTGTTTFLVP